MTSELLIRPARAGDAERCAEIYRPFVEETWVSMETTAPGADEMRRRIAAQTESHAWCIAERGGEIVGYAYGGPHRTRAGYDLTCETAVYVDPRFAGTGVGRALYRELLPKLAARGMHSAIAVIALPGDASIALHEAAGYRRVGTFAEAGFKLGKWCDTLWMQCPLTDAS